MRLTLDYLFTHKKLHSGRGLWPVAAQTLETQLATDLPGFSFPQGIWTKRNSLWRLDVKEEPHTKTSNGCVMLDNDCITQTLSFTFCWKNLVLQEIAKVDLHRPHFQKSSGCYCGANFVEPFENVEGNLPMKAKRQSAETDNSFATCNTPQRKTFSLCQSHSHKDNEFTCLSQAVPEINCDSMELTENQTSDKKCQKTCNSEPLVQSRVHHDTFRLPEESSWTSEATVLLTTSSKAQWTGKLEIHLEQDGFFHCPFWHSASRVPRRQRWKDARERGEVNQCSTWKALSLQMHLCPFKHKIKHTKYCEYLHAAISVYSKLSVSVSFCTSR